MTAAAGLGLRVALVTMLLLGALAGMVAWRQAPLLTGREIVLATEPVDPRSLFRGDYVDLTYTISRLSEREMPLPPLTEGETVYVALTADSEEGAWRAAGVMTRRPIGPLLFLRGRVQALWQEPLPDPETGDSIVPLRPASPCGDDACRTILVDYGIGSYFVPEGSGRRLEDLVREGGRLAVVAAVDSQGRAVIAGLMVDGTRITREGLF